MNIVKIDWKSFIYTTMLGNLRSVQLIEIDIMASWNIHLSSKSWLLHRQCIWILNSFFFVNKNSMYNRLCVRNLQIVFLKGLLGWAMIPCILHKGGTGTVQLDENKIYRLRDLLFCLVPMSPVPVSLVPRLSAPVPWIYWFPLYKSRKIAIFNSLSS